MGNEGSKASSGGDVPALDHARTQVARIKAIVGGKGEGRKAAPGIRGPAPSNHDHDTIMTALQQLLLFNHLDKTTQRRIVADMYERVVPAGEILISQGDVGPAASQLYVVKSGKFEVLEKRKNVMFKVNTKAVGDCFGEISLMYNCPRSATVAATTDAVVWVLERDMFRHYVQVAAEEGFGEVELFLNSVPLLNSLNREQKMALVDAFDEIAYEAEQVVIKQGDIGDKFYIIKDGEAQVLADGVEVNRLFRADFFGEQALLHDEPRKATVLAAPGKKLVVLALDRTTFVNVLGPLQDLMAKEKSEEAVNTRMAKLAPQSAAIHKRPTAEVELRPVSGGAPTIATGHLDEVQELRRGGTKLTEDEGSGKADERRLVIVEGQVLGEGAFSRVCKVTEESTGRQFAMKRMSKVAAMQCPDHVFCEQRITRNMAHPFCIRQYASFKDPQHLYMLFDLMPGGDLMDVLVAEAKVIKYPMEEDNSQKGMFAQKVKMWQGMAEDLAKFYVASIVLALEYLHNNNLVFRDLKPENVLVDSQGYAKLGDFGFAKYVEYGARTYTFCGTPGYVAPENIMGRGYGHSVDWWTLGVLTYVLLTARQPFTSPKTQDPMEVMRRIVNERWPIRYPPYMSDTARDLISRLLERKPIKRIGCLQNRAGDIKKHPWFAGFDWDALATRRMNPPRKPKEEDSAKRKAELEASPGADANKEKPTQAELEEWERTFKDF